MRILYGVSQAAGGIRSHLVELVRHFAARYPVAVVSPHDGGLGERVEAAGGVFHEKGGIPGGVLATRTIIRDFNPGLIHFHGCRAGMAGRISSLGVEVPLVVTLHNFLVYPDRGWIPAGPYYFLERVSSSRVGKYIAVSEALRQDFLKRSGVSPEKVAVVHNGIRAGVYHEAPPLGGLKDLGSPLIGAALRLTPQKGVDILVEAAPAVLARYPGAVILICGEGPMEGRLRQRIQKLGLAGKVHLLGFLDDLPGFLATLDLFVLPSRTEGLGITLLEALASGTPVVAADAGGIGEVVTDGIHGLLVPPRDPRGLAEGILALLEDQDLRRRVVEDGRKRIQEQFLLEDMLEKTAGVYESLLQGVGKGLAWP